MQDCSKIPLGSPDFTKCVQAPLPNPDTVNIDKCIASQNIVEGAAGDKSAAPANTGTVSASAGGATATAGNGVSVSAKSNGLRTTLNMIVFSAMVIGI